MAGGITAVYIGRFQPPHDGHIATMRSALAQFGRLLVLPGSANLARSSKNPWTAAERSRMIRAALQAAGENVRRVRFAPLPDEFDPERWAALVRQTAAKHAGASRAALVGFEKDASSRYLHWFPDWQFVQSPVVTGLSATDIRAAYFEGRPLRQVPRATAEFLEEFSNTRLFVRLQTEHFAVQAEQSRLTAPPHTTRREVRFCWLADGHIWLGRRTGPVGRGLWELPGHALQPQQAPPPHARLFDAPGRSLLGPSAAYVVRQPGGGVPVPLDLALSRPHRFFEDHHVILRRMLGA